MSEAECLQGYDEEDYEDKANQAETLADCLKCEVEKCPVKNLLMEWRLQPL